MDRQSFRCKLMWTAAGVLLFAALFPPFTGRRTANSPERFIGFHFLFDDPEYKSDKPVTYEHHRSVDGMEGLEQVEEGRYYPAYQYHGSRVDTGRLLCEVLILSALAAAGWLWSARPGRQRRST